MQTKILLQGTYYTCIYTVASLPAWTVRESWNGLGWKGLERIIQSQHPSTLGHIFYQPRLLRAPSNLALNTARNGAGTASLGNMCQGLTTLTVKSFFCLSNLNLLSFSLKPSPLVLSLHALVKSPSPALSQPLQALAAALRCPCSFSSPG